MPVAFNFSREVDIVADVVGVGYQKGTGDAKVVCSRVGESGGLKGFVVGDIQVYEVAAALFGGALARNMSASFVANQNGLESQRNVRRRPN